MGRWPSTAASVLLLPVLAHQHVFFRFHLPSSSISDRISLCIPGCYGILLPLHHSGSRAYTSRFVLHLELQIHVQLSRQQAHSGHPTDTDLMLHTREDPTGDCDQRRLGRDSGGAALPARGRGGRSTGEPGATNRGRGMLQAFRRPGGPRQPAAETSLAA